MEIWVANQDYTCGDVVLHDTALWQRERVSPKTHEAPAPGSSAWRELTNTNATDYLKVSASLSTYEQRKALHQAAVLDALAQAGLNAEDVKAALDADVVPVKTPAPVQMPTVPDEFFTQLTKGMSRKQLDSLIAEKLSGQDFSQFKTLPVLREAVAFALTVELAQNGKV